MLHAPPRTGPHPEPAAGGCGWAPPPAEHALDRAAPARVCEALLGGHATTGADRAVADTLTAAVPDAAAALAWAGRAFLTRAVRHLLALGVGQFLDLGCGLPTTASLHHLLTTEAPHAACVHVDIDPIAAEYTAHTIGGSHRAGPAAALCADLSQPDRVLGHPHVHRLLDLQQPAAIIATGVLHHLPDPGPVLAAYRDATVTGSALVLTHLCGDARPADTAHLTEVYRSAGIGVTPRSRTAVTRLLHSYTPTPPGVCWAPSWRPEPDPPDPQPQPSDRPEPGTRSRTPSTGRGGLLLAALGHHLPPP
jgi:SAM-dependent methyltransferase